MPRINLRGGVRTTLKALAAAAAAGVAVAVTAGALFAVEVLSREPLRAVPSTTHSTITRSECIGCHAPIAEEWRRSYHYRSLTGAYWKETRDLGYMEVFNRTRKACVNCHAPANVLDLSEATSASSSDGSLGVECTPNLLKEPRGVFPAARRDDVELGVDCTACHVSREGILGSGRRPSSAHGVVADPRFQSPARAAETLCRTCHSATVRAWAKTSFAARGVTCLDCHMPITTAASTVDGPVRTRRSHAFMADKDPTLLEHAVHASVEVTPDRQARFRIVNDRVGHFFPSGGNWLSVKLTVRPETGPVAAEKVVVFGREEPLVLDFWPFNRDRRIASGEQREALLPLPDGHGVVEAVVRYHDWMRTKTDVVTLRGTY